MLLQQLIFRMIFDNDGDEVVVGEASNERVAQFLVDDLRAISVQSFDILADRRADSEDHSVRAPVDLIGD